VTSVFAGLSTPVAGLVRLGEWSIAEAPVPDLAVHLRHALGVGHLAGRVAEIELAQVAVQVIDRHGVVGSV